MVNVNKKCGKCNILKSSSNFSEDKHTKSGLTNYCKTCKNEIEKIRRKEVNKEKIWIDFKKCSLCKEEKSRNFFFHNKYTKTGLTSWCRKCHSKKGTTYHYSKKYSLTLEQIEDRLKRQEFKCPICLKEISMKTLNVDHCHSSGIIRGLLCNPCNIGLGSFRDNISSLKRSIEYLEVHDEVK